MISSMDPLQEGNDAFEAGLLMSTNPYTFTLSDIPDDENNAAWMDWNLGYYKARKRSLNLKDLES